MQKEIKIIQIKLDLEKEVGRLQSCCVCKFNKLLIM